MHVSHRRAEQHDPRERHDRARGVERVRQREERARRRGVRSGPRGDARARHMVARRERRHAARHVVREHGRVRQRERAGAGERGDGPRDARIVPEQACERVRVAAADRIEDAHRQERDRVDRGAGAVAQRDAGGGEDRRDAGAQQREQRRLVGVVMAAEPDLVAEPDRVRRAVDDDGTFCRERVHRGDARAVVPRHDVRFRHDRAEHERGDEHGDHRAALHGSAFRRARRAA